MSLRHFDKLFAPQSIALIGASRKADSVGGVLARNLAGFAGKLWLVNPAATSIAVTHGCAVQGISLSQFHVVPDSAWGSTTKWWISNNTGTAFTVNVDVAPGGAGMTFRWFANTGKKPIT